MNALFLSVVNRSISASWLILAVIILRGLLKKAPRWSCVLLWGMVALRLICPISVESNLSLIPSVQTIPDAIMTQPVPTVQTGIPAVNRVLNPLLESSLAPSVENSANPAQIVIFVLCTVWRIGAAALMLYAIVCDWRLRRKVSTAVCCKDNVFRSEKISVPFVLGLFKPKIYLPVSITDQELVYVLAHEQAHIGRKDHWWKPLGFLLMTIYWFNPLMWISYALLCRDIEFACDEKVIRDFENEQKADYAQALLDCSVAECGFVACPLAFGEIGIKKRVRSVLRYKKPGIWMSLVVMLVCAVVAVCFLTNPPTGMPTGSVSTSDVIQWFDYLNDPSAMAGGLTIQLPEYPGVTFQYTKEQIIASKGFDGSELEGNTILIAGWPIWNGYFCDVTGDGLPDLCATYSFGFGMIDSRIVIVDYANGASYELSDRGNYDFALRKNEGDGRLYVDQSDYHTSELIRSGQLIFADGALQVTGFSEEIR